MSTESKKSTITIDGKAYALDDLSANARSQIVNLRVTDQEIARLQTQLAIAPDRPRSLCPGAGRRASS